MGFVHHDFFFRHDFVLGRFDGRFMLKLVDMKWIVSQGGAHMFAVGVSLLAVGLGTSNPGFWIPGIAFMAIGLAQRAKR